MKHAIHPCLWFDGQAQAAADFYAATFPDAQVVDSNPMVAHVKIGELTFMLLDGGPEYRINPSISFFYHCRDEAQIDGLWNTLSQGGSPLMPLDNYPFAKKYGWIADRFGVNWQLILSEAQPHQRVFPSLMFTQNMAGRAEEALRFYTSLFAQSSIGNLSRYGADQLPDREGTLNYGEFSLENQWFTVMDSAHPHQFNFTEGVSLFLSCTDQADIDFFWERLSQGGEEGRCGWLKDKFGVSWQIVPKILGELMSDPQRAGRVVQAFMPMKKLIIAELEKA